MTEQGSATPAPPAEQSFTQADVDRIVADRLKREREKFADYDALKASAAQVEALREQLDAANQTATSKTVEATRLQVAFTSGLTPDDLEFLGDDPEQFEARASKLRARIGTAKAEPASAPPGPRPDLSQGGTGEALPLNGDPIEQALRAKLGIT